MCLCVFKNMEKVRMDHLLTTNLMESRKRWWNWLCWNLSSGLSALYTIPHELQVVAPNCFWPASCTQEIHFFQTLVEKVNAAVTCVKRQRTMTSWSSSCLSFRLRTSRSLAADEDCDDAAGPEGVLQDRGDCRALLNLRGTKKEKKG